MNQHRNTWTTNDELEYLATIGEHTMCFKHNKHRTSAGVQNTLKKWVLKKAIDAYAKRANWGEMDRNKIIEFAKVQLAGL